MGANRSGDNLRRKRKRHVKNMVTRDAALAKRTGTATATKPAKVAKAAKPKALATDAAKPAKTAKTAKPAKKAE